MPFFRKKPVVIEAVKFEYTAAGLHALAEFCDKALGRIRGPKPELPLAEAEIRTLEDGAGMKVVHIATEGDWIIKGVQGEFYACKPDIFEATYETVQQEAASVV